MQNQEWLTNLTPNEIQNGPFPLSDILDGSLYYPASGTDGSPIRHWEIGVDSFVYVDFSITRQYYVQEINHGAFNGYALLANREVSINDLTPNGFDFQIPTCINKRRYIDAVRMALADGTGPFGMWSVFERLPAFGENHGPKRFSLVHIRGEGCATYQAIYDSNGLLPKVVTLVRPGTGFGGNFSNFEEAFLETMNLHPRGLPPQLLTWHFRNQPPTQNCIQDLYPTLTLGPLSKDGEPGFSISLFTG